MRKRDTRFLITLFVERIVGDCAKGIPLEQIAGPQKKARPNRALDYTYDNY
jgi:hypothetical protein